MAVDQNPLPPHLGALEAFAEACATLPAPGISAYQVLDLVASVTAATVSALVVANAPTSDIQLTMRALDMLGRLIAHKADQGKRTWIADEIRLVCKQVAAYRFPPIDAEYRPNWVTGTQASVDAFIGSTIPFVPISKADFLKRIAIARANVVADDARAGYAPNNPFTLSCIASCEDLKLLVEQSPLDVFDETQLRDVCKRSEQITLARDPSKGETIH